jgi:hypothetical protein
LHAHTLKLNERHRRQGAEKEAERQRWGRGMQRRVAKAMLLNDALHEENEELRCNEVDADDAGPLVAACRAVSRARAAAASCNVRQRRPRLARVHALNCFDWLRQWRRAASLSTHDQAEM